MDKVQKIREEVERMHNLLPVMDGDNISVNYADRICTTLEMYIDSLQEKPVPRVFEDMLNAKTAAESLGISPEEHDKIVDECLYGKEPELVDVDDLPNKKEELVSNDFEMALAEMIDKAQTSVIEPLVVAAQWKDELIKLAKSEEPVSEDLEEAADDALNNVLNTHEIVNIRSCLEMFRFGAKWQKEQFEKERLKHCDALTEEQAQIESDFVIQHLKKNNRTPTFIDAIEYGMRLQKEKMMKDATDAVVHIEAGNYPYIPQIELYDYDKDVPLAKEGDKYKVVLIKED